jgi:hypothetical protein
MPRGMVGLLAAVAVAMSTLVSFIHGDLVWAVIVDAAAAAGLVAYASAPSAIKKEGASITLAMCSLGEREPAETLSLARKSDEPWKTR